MAERTISGLIEDIKKYLLNLRSGDCATLLVMRVPDPDVELIRAFIDFPRNHKQLMTRITTRVEALSKNPDFDIRRWGDAIIEKLSTEREISPGSRGEAPKQLVYTEAQLFQAKYAIQKIALLQFSQKLNNKDEKGQLMKVADRNAEFTKFKTNLKLVHRNPGIDGFFGIKNTTLWRTTMAEIRTAALNHLLNKEVNEAKDLQAKINLLTQARSMEIFTDHRNNFIVSGAFGATSAKKEIDRKLESLERELKSGIRQDQVFV